MIDLTGVVKQFGSHPVLRGISLTVPSSSVYGVIGSNGAGKTTLLNLMAGIYRTDEGEVQILGEPVFDNAAVKQRLFYLPDELYFQPFASLERMARFYAGYYPRFRMDTFEKLVELFQLPASKRIHGYSKGMQRQAGLVLALCARPEVLLLDEVFDGLDPQKRSLARSLLLEYMAETEAAICISSHNLRELSGFCDHVAFLEDGRLPVQGEVEELLEDAGRFRVVFDSPRTVQDFEGIAVMELRCNGKTAAFFVPNGKEECRRRLKALGARQMEEFPVTLEDLYLARGHRSKVDLNHIFE